MCLSLHRAVEQPCWTSESQIATLNVAAAIGFHQQREMRVQLAFALSDLCGQGLMPIASAGYQREALDEIFLGKTHKMN